MVTGPNSIQAPDAGPFVEELLLHVTGWNCSVADATARQDSTIGASSISALGSAVPRASLCYPNPPALAVATASSFAEFVFDVDTYSAYSLIGSVSEAFANASVSLAGAQGPVAGVAANGIQSVDERGILSPGRYTLTVQAQATDYYEFFSFNGSSGFNIDLQVSSVQVNNYCTAAPNSSGASAELSPLGSLSVAENEFGLEAHGAVPQHQGLFFYGPNQISVPFGDGFRCVGGHVNRLHPPMQADQQGHLSRMVDLTIPPAGGGGPGTIHGGATWNFQLWYRDPVTGMSGYNLSDGLEVTFQP